MIKYLIGASFLAIFAFAESSTVQAQQSTVVATCGAESIPTSQGTSGTFIAADGSLCTSGSGGGGSNAAAGPTGSAVPADGSYNALNVGGTLRGQTGSNPVGTTYSAHTDLTSVGGVSMSAGAGAVGTSTPRFAIGQDATTMAGSAPGTAGTPATTVGSVQGVSGGTPLPASIADAADVTLGAKADAATCVTTNTAIACLRQIDADVKGSIPAGAALIGKVGIDQTTPGTTNAVQNVAGTAGGAGRYTGSITNTAVAVDASAGQMYAYYFDNPNASECFVQFWNTAQGSVTVGTTAPVLSLGIPANGAANMSLPVGDAYSTAITIAATTARAGGTACGSNVNANIWFK